MSATDLLSALRIKLCLALFVTFQKFREFIVNLNIYNGYLKYMDIVIKQTRYAKIKQFDSGLHCVLFNQHFLNR